MTDMLSQEEIDALLKGSSDNSSNDKNLTSEEMDALGEIGNISMGTAATTLFTLLGHKVTITTPKVSVGIVSELSDYYSVPCVAVIIKYKQGIEGFNLLILKEKDVKIITDLMMGGDGTNISQELTDLHLSAISEAMNQMIGSACTSLSEIFNKKIDIFPPEAYPIDLAEKKYDTIPFDSNDKIVRIAFSMTVGDIIDSEIMQVIPIDFAKKMVSNILKPSFNKGGSSDMNHPMEEKEVKKENNYRIDNTSEKELEKNTKTNINESVNVKAVKFENFDELNNENNITNDIDLIKDVPLGITVELGRTVKRISEILEFNPGTVIELDKLVGEPLDILVNGKLIAHGEVVVVDENYGIRITNILAKQK